jgi:dienelactone hydrolase
VSIQTRNIEYRDGNVVLEAYMAWDESSSDKRPGVLVSHAWRGRSEFEESKAHQLAELGYVGFALDLYGKGVLGTNTEENRALMQPLLDDRAMLLARMKLATTVLRKQKEVDAARIAALGFCFGGLCVLDLARSGADICGVASFHGLFGAPPTASAKPIKAKVLAMHGWDDPMATPEQVLAFTTEMTSLDVDWQLHAYGKTMHAFTNPVANDPAFGTVYNASADRRSWQNLQLFLAAIF